MKTRNEKTIQALHEKWTATALLIWTLLLAVALIPSSQAESRSKVLSFDDDVIEGVQKIPLDSLTQLSQKNGGEKPHLYRKRAAFPVETRESLAEFSLVRRN